VALYFCDSEGFPTDKDAGKHCINLKSDFKCAVHKNLGKKDLKGCTAYDCFGAGQKVAQVTYSGYDWRTNPETAKQMFDVFLVMKQLHEMLWYLTKAFRMQYDSVSQEKISYMISETVRLANLDADIRGANLTNSIFITQAQINAAKGDSNTRLPMSLAAYILG
jgi:uncharacterized protein YjbI with pentapeptide repeats